VFFRHQLWPGIACCSPRGFTNYSIFWRDILASGGRYSDLAHHADPTLHFWLIFFNHIADISFNTSWLEAKASGQTVEIA
jgi:hypothetical protein